MNKKGYENQRENKSKSWVFKKINKMDKFLVKLKKKKGFYLFKCP